MSPTKQLEIGDLGHCLDSNARTESVEQSAIQVFMTVIIGSDNITAGPAQLPVIFSPEFLKVEICVQIALGLENQS